MTQETKRELLRDYENKNITVGEIATKYGISRAAVTQIAVEQGGAATARKSLWQKTRAQRKDLPEVQKAN